MLKLTIILPKIIQYVIERVMLMNHKVISLTLISTLSLLTGCYANSIDSSEPQMLSENNLISLNNSNNHKELSNLKDGIYFAEDSSYSDEGWKNIVTLNIQNGLITMIELNSINQNATTDKQTLSQTGEYIIETLDETSLPWHEQIEELENYILNYQDFLNIKLTEEEKNNKLPNITIEIQPFLELINNAILAGPIEKGNYQDGHYYSEQENFTNNYKSTINLIVHNGYIIGAHWDFITKEGTSINEEQTNQIQTWNEQAQLLENYLIEIQDPTLITFNEENKTEAINGVTVEVNPFIQLAIEALAKGPILN